MAKFQMRLGLVIGLCYMLTLCVIYKCVPLAPMNSTKDSDLHHFFNNKTASLITMDPYKLHWNAKEKVYFKKVKDTVHDNENTIRDKDEDIKCNGNIPTQFVKISAVIYIYSAHYDSRNGTAYIRAIAAVSRSIPKQQLDTTLLCLFERSEHGNKSKQFYSPIQSYEMCENHKKKYGGWVLSCKVPIELLSIPKKMQIAIRETNEVSVKRSKKFCIIARDENVSRRKLPFGICVPPLYGQIKAKSLIEFIEFNRILGANIFILYIENAMENLSAEIRQIIRYYERQNIVMWFPWQLPFPVDSIWYHGQSLAINDCLYRNMDKFEYLAFTDVDEFIVPQRDLYTWNDVINDLDQRYSNLFKNAIAMTFKSTFYSEEFSRRTFSNEMTMSVRTNRTKHFSFRRNKVLVRPDKIFELGIHHVSKPFHELDSQNIVKVPTDIAHIHHYRACVQEFGIHCQIRIEDFSVPNKYGQSIIDNYLKTLYDITP